MLISEDKSFLYYHLYKVAGTSIREALRPYCSKKQVILQNLNYAASLFGQVVSRDPTHHFHPRLIDVKEKLGDKYNDYFKFTFVRDPLDWQKSLFFFAKKNPRHHQHKLIKPMDFNQYIDWRVHEDLKLQSDLIYDKEDCLVDKIFKFENLNEEFEFLKKKLAIEGKLEHRNIAGKGKPVSMSDASRQLFVDAFKQDYKNLGYELKL